MGCSFPQFCIVAEYEDIPMNDPKIVLKINRERREDFVSLQLVRVVV